MPLSAVDYRPRDAEHGVLYRVIGEHLEAFLETARRHADGAALPEFVKQEFRDFLTCGVLAHGFARLRCTDCAFFAAIIGAAAMLTTPAAAHVIQATSSLSLADVDMNDTPQLER